MKMKKIYHLLLLLCCVMICSCNKQEQLSFSPMAYADLLRIHEGSGWTGVEVINAWKKDQIAQRYILVPRNADIPDDIPEGTLIRTPLQRAILFSAVHGALCLDLGCISQVAGMCDTEYILNDSLQQLIKNGEIANMGSSMQADAERMAAARPDAFFVSPFENAGYGILSTLGVPLIECADYMETSALGRAEWMKFYGLLMGCEAKADSLFAAVEKDYLQLSKQMEDIKDKPTLLCDLKQGSAWYVPGSNSYIGQLFADAGAQYIFADNQQNGSVAMSFENVYAKGHNADLWVIKYGRDIPYTYTTLAEDYPLNRQFAAWKNRKIYGCNTFHSLFYEEVPFHPNRLLRDIIKICHPEALPHYVPTYYRPLSE